MPTTKLSTKSTLSELLEYPDQNIYRHALAILKHLNEQKLKDLKEEAKRAQI